MEEGFYSEFEPVRLNACGEAQVRQVRRMFDRMLSDFLQLVDHQPSRELSICRTKLEEACFFAVKAVTNAEGNQA